MKFFYTQKYILANIEAEFLMLDVISAGEFTQSVQGLDTSDKTMPVIGSEVELSRDSNSATNLSQNVLSAKDLFKPVADYSSPEQEFKRKQLPKMFYLSSATMHLLNSLFSELLPKNIKEQFDKATVNYSKLGHSLIQLDLAKESYNNNRAFDFIAKIIEPLLLIVADLRDIPLIKGFSGALNMLDFSQAGKVGNQQQSLAENFLETIQAQKKILHQLLEPEAAKKYLFNNRNKEKGHTMALSGYIMLAGASLGTLFGFGKRNQANGLGRLIKNTGALVSNYSMWVHPAKNLSKAGKIYAADALLDSFQYLVKDSLVRPLSHMVMAINNLASHYYTQSSRNINEANTLLYA
jgi:hypothetical protein